MAPKNVKKLSTDDLKLDIENPSKNIHQLIREYDSAVKDRADKMQAGKDHLVERIKVMAEKYRTVSGVLAAIDSIKMMYDFTDIKMAKRLASITSKNAMLIREAINKAGIEELDDILEGFYDHDFCDRKNDDIERSIEEIMTLDLLRNIGPSIDDIVGFGERAEEELEKLRKELTEIDPDWQTIELEEQDGSTED